MDACCSRNSCTVQGTKSPSVMQGMLGTSAGPRASSCLSLLTITACVVCTRLCWICPSMHFRIITRSVKRPSINYRNGVSFQPLRRNQLPSFQLLPNAGAYDESPIARSLHRSEKHLNGSGGHPIVCRCHHSSADASQYQQHSFALKSIEPTPAAFRRSQLRLR